MSLEEIELRILRTVVEEYSTKRIGIDNFIIAEKLNIDPQLVADILVMLKDQGYVRVSQMSGGYYVAFPEPKGQLMINFPEYMKRKLSGPIILDALSDAIEQSENIPETNKKSLIDKLKDVKNDPYLSSIGSGLIVEALKKFMGL